MRVKYLEPDYRRNPKTDLHCFLCQKDIKPDSPYRMIHVVAGGAQVLHPEDEHLYDNDDPGNLGLQPIGPDCAKRLGLEWSASYE